MFNLGDYCLVLLVLSAIDAIKCELSLKILKNTGDYYTPVSSTVEEKVGANFSLFCDLVSSNTNSDYYDYQMSWVRQPKSTNDLRFWKEENLIDNNNNSDRSKKKMYSILTQTDVNKAVKRFDPLQITDRGHYFCISLKYNLRKAIEIIVRDELPSIHRYFDERRRDSIFCSEQMFQCVSNGVCIIHHYICDGKADCQDESDESDATCHGEPCKNKLQCEDGRCIPTSWCCDRHHDPNCTVTNRPKCCQILSESYEELEYGLPVITRTNNGARYLFISVCILSILFFMVLLVLILSKVLKFAKKTALQQTNRNCSRRRGRRGVGNVMRNGIGRSNLNIGTIDTAQSICLASMTFCNNNNNNLGFATPMTLTRDNNCDASDPLLFPPLIDEQPPSYGDVVRAQQNNSCSSRLTLNEPPPPYASREMLNLFILNELERN